MTFRGLSVKALIILQMAEDEAALLLLLVGTYTPEWEHEWPRGRTCLVRVWYLLGSQSLSSRPFVLADLTICTRMGVSSPYKQSVHFRMSVLGCDVPVDPHMLKCGSRSMEQKYGIEYWHERKKKFQIPSFHGNIILFVGLQWLFIVLILKK